MNKDFSTHKAKLLEEKRLLEEELSHLGTKNPEIKGEWMATPSDIGHDDGKEESQNEADILDTGVKMENAEERISTENTLAIQYKSVLKALEAIERGLYGTCTIGKNHVIDPARLEATPSATTCIFHAK
mgnify:CR=1 FL=1